MTKRIARTARRLLEDQRGITGLETAIVLIAFVVVSSVFAYGILNTGIFSADRSKESINSSMTQTRSNLELKGAVVGIADTGKTKVEKVKFYLGTAAGAEPIDFQAGTLVMTYLDRTKSEVIAAANISITARGTDNGDTMLDPAETREVEVTLPTTVTLGTNTSFSIEIRPRVGSVMNLSRTTPFQITEMMNLN